MLDLTVRGTLLLAVAFLVVAALRRAPAAARHLVWATALAGLLILPALPAVVPSWTVAVPAVAVPGLAGMAFPEAPDVARVANAPVGDGVVSRTRDMGAVHTRTYHRRSTSRRQVAELTPVIGGGASEAAGQRSEAVGATVLRASPGGSRQGAIAAWVWWVLWGLGAAAVMARLAFGLWRLRAALRMSRPIDDPAWTRLVQAAARRFGVHRPIVLYRGSAGVVPITSGILRPVIILPADADAWDEERRQLVLTHEIAHVRRLDVLTHIVGQLAVAVFWFHPLAWIAAARMRLERERACDDLVLAAGARPSRYAGDLLELAQTLRGGTVPAAAALAMARRTEIEGRLLAILDGAVCRRPLGARRIAPALAVAAVAIGALAVVRPVTASPATPRESRAHGHPGDDLILADAASAAGRVTSEVAKRQRLLEVALRHSTADTVRRALFGAIATMRSDVERRKVLLGTLGRGTRDDDTVAEVVRAAGAMTSDVEKSRVLRTVAGVDHLADTAVRTAFFAATNTIASNTERTAVLLAVLGEVRARAERTVVDDAIARRSIASVRTLTSIPDKTRVLREVVRSGWLTKGDVQRQFNICVSKGS
ncbi:MAG TPA: M56 family metallopeptidase [Gemmatimonadaceae bacterium]|nr:M56 family metallopeptidase [Gemmatimonadaceae bacterium]